MRKPKLKAEKSPIYSAVFPGLCFVYSLKVIRLFSKIWGKFTRKTKFSLWRAPVISALFVFKWGHSGLAFKDLSEITVVGKAAKVGNI